LRRGFKTESERNATQLRKELGVQPKEPLRARTLARHMQIPIVLPTHIHGLTQEDFTELCGRGSSSWSAVTIVTPKKTFIILNPSHAEVRQESNIMHELAHLICEHQPSEIVQLRGFNFLIRTCNKPQEEEADWVCGCLKLPRDGILWAVRGGKTHEEIAEHFVASIDLVRFRINKTGVETQVRRARQKWK